VEDLDLEVFTMVCIRGISILYFSGQHVTEDIIDIKELPEDDQERSKHFGILTNFA